MQGLIREFPKGLLNWYEFHKGSRVLFVTGGMPKFEVLTELLEERGLAVDRMDVQEILQGTSVATQSVYTYIVFVGALERSGKPKELLYQLRKLLATDGRLLFGMDNRLGIRYFCGDRDAFTNRNFDSIENYRGIAEADLKKMGGRAYSKAEVESMLDQAGFARRRFYSVFPNIEMPQLVYAEDYLSEEELEVRTWPEYNCSDTVFLEEEKLYPTLIENGLFHVMANGYLVECPLQGDMANVKHVTTSMSRGRENAMATVIGRDERVRKLALYPEGMSKLEQMLANDEDLRGRGIRVVDSKLENGAYVMPYIQGESVVKYFRRLLYENVETLVAELDRYWNIILGSSEHVPYEEVDWEHFQPGWENRKADDPVKEKWKRMAFGEEKEVFGPILKRGYIDLVSLNCFRVEDEFVFYDQEFWVENLPARTIMWRVIDFIYAGDLGREAIYPSESLYEKYGIKEHQSLYMGFAEYFIKKLRHDEVLRSHYTGCRCDIRVLNSNRQRMNYSSYEYRRLFQDIFRNVEGRKLYLFGSGNFTKKFLSEFGEDYEIAGILDNNSQKWGQELEGIAICSPEILRELEPNEYKVIVCIKNYVPVIKQLQDLGVKEYGIYDWNLEYPRKVKSAACGTELAMGTTEQNAPPKKYHIGYVAGVFDMFHKGHLNLLRRAKEQCDYLIAGVVTDEAVRRDKGTNPVIPFEERLEIVAACRYVDEAVRIPPEFADSDEAYRRYQFDVQFSGSDYADDPKWLAKQAYLRQRGSDLVFFPYTEGTSSTKLKAVIEKKLEGNS